MLQKILGIDNQLNSVHYNLCPLIEKLDLITFIKEMYNSKFPFSFLS